MPNVQLFKNIHPVHGAFLHAAVGRNRPDRRSLLKKLLPLPDDAQAVLLADTGAAYTCVDQRILNGLGIESTGQQLIFPVGADGPDWWPTYVVSLQLRDDQGNEHSFGTLEVCAWDFSGRHHQGLLGRDVLNLCRFDYDGRSKRFTLMFHVEQ